MYFWLQKRILPTNKTSNFRENYHIISIMQNKGHFVSEQCNYYINKCCTGNVVVQNLVLVIRSPFFLCYGHTSKSTCDQEHCTQPTTTYLPIKCRLTWGIKRVCHIGNWQVVTFGQIFIKIKVVIVVNSLNMFLMKGKHVFSMLSKIMKHLEVRF